tara:strand:+ start:134 stop:346 length:213 start_codon:yes stop_codon:yes gene_type:complete
MLGSRISKDVAMITPAQKMKTELQKHVSYWQTEFDLDKWQVSGVLFEIAMDALMVIEVEDNHDDDDDDDM